MAVQPLTGACFSVFANVVFMFNLENKHHLAVFVKGFFV